MRWTLAFVPFLLAGAAQAADPASNPPEDVGQASRHAQVEQRWKEADKDGNGLLSRSEAEASMPRLAENFDAFDANKDGQVSRDEMRAMHRERRQHTREAMRDHFKAADKNDDGAIDEAEAKASLPKLAEHFAEVDSNHDGKVTPQEMKAHHAQRKESRPAKPAG